MALRNALLTLLARERLSGYDLLTYFDGSVGFVWHATHPQIYGELKKLRREKLVSQKLVVQTGRPNKKIYSLTEKGEQELLKWVATPAPEQTMKDGMLLRAFSYGRIDPAVAIACLEEYRARHAERLGSYRELTELASASPADASRIGSLLTLRAGVLHEEAYLKWCEWAIEFLRGRRPAPRRRSSRARS